MRIFAMLMACVSAASSVSADEIPRSGFVSGNWTGSAHTYDDGTFSHCVISAPYVVGDIVYLSVTEAATLVVGVYSPRLSIVPGAEYPVSLRIDRRFSTQAIALAEDSRTAFVELLDFDHAMNSIRFGNMLTIEGNGFLGQYRLSGTAVALNSAFDCALNYLDYRAPGISTTPPEVAATEIERLDRTYLFQAATQAISELDLTDFQYVTESEMTEFGLSPNSVYWYSESSGMMGGVFLEVAEGDSLRQSDPTDAEFLAASCDGDFATSARDLANYAVPAREVRMLCLEDDEPYEVLLTKLLIGDLVLYSELRFFGTEDEISDSRSPQTDSEAVAQRLVSFALQ